MGEEDCRKGFLLVQGLFLGVCRVGFAENIESSCSESRGLRAAEVSLRETGEGSWAILQRSMKSGRHRRAIGGTTIECRRWILHRWMIR